MRDVLAAQNRKPGKHPPVKAIIPVHLYGHPCDMDALLAIAKEYGLAVIEDAAHALPAKYKGRMIGSLGEDSPVPVLTCFSFYATKNLTTAEGGMLTGTADLLDQARVWSLHGMSRDAWKRYGSAGSWLYEVVCPGFKYNMTDIQAAIGLHQLRKLPAFHRRRREIAQRYTRAFQHVAELQTPPEAPGAGHAWHLYVLRLHLDRLRLTRDALLAELHHVGSGPRCISFPSIYTPTTATNTGILRRIFPWRMPSISACFRCPARPACRIRMWRTSSRLCLSGGESRRSGSRAKPLACSRIFALSGAPVDSHRGGSVPSIQHIRCHGGLAALSPLFAVAALAIRREDGGPVFYAQARVGQRIPTFRVLKFRSMVPNADRAGC